MRAWGHLVWAVPGGRIPEKSTGEEPEGTSYDMVCLLNTGDSNASVVIWAFYEHREPIGPYIVEVPARRVRHVRLNDLIDPEAMPLGTEYGLVIQSDVPVVVQFWRQDTERGKAIATTTAVPLE